jgi:hypothetical protein
LAAQIAMQAVPDYAAAIQSTQETRMAEISEARRLRQKLDQARTVIAHLVTTSGSLGSEGRRAVDYFGDDDFDPDFLPWPRHPDEGTRPEDLNAANDG